MYKRILVPLDGSSLGEAILPHATAIAACFQATLVLLRVSISAVEAIRQSTPIDPITVVPVALDLADDLVQSEFEAAETYLKRMGTSLDAQKIAYEALIMEGDPVGALQQAVKEQRIDLVTMATHGRSTLGRLFQGSVAESLVHEVGVPILLLHVRT